MDKFGLDNLNMIERISNQWAESYSVHFRSRAMMTIWKKATDIMLYYGYDWDNKEHYVKLEKMYEVEETT